MDEHGGARIPISRRLFAYDDDLDGMRKFSTFMSSGCLYRRSIHQEIGLFDEQIHHYWDWDFYLRVVRNSVSEELPWLVCYMLSRHQEIICQAIWRICDHI